MTALFIGIMMSIDTRHGFDSNDREKHVFNIDRKHRISRSEFLSILKSNIVKTHSSAFVSLIVVTTQDVIYSQIRLVNIWQ